MLQSFSLLVHGKPVQNTEQAWEQNTMFLLSYDLAESILTPLAMQAEHGRMNYKDTKPYMSALL